MEKVRKRELLLFLLFLHLTPIIMSLTSNLTIPEDAITKTKYGDIGIITYKPLIPAEIEASVRSKKAGAVVSFVSFFFSLFTFLFFLSFLSLLSLLSFIITDVIR